MNVENYQEVKALFRRDWDAPILDILARSPCRYTDLARRLRKDVDVGIPDGSLNRSLARLQEQDLICAVDDRGDDGPGPGYKITDLGRRQLKTYRVILEAYRRSRSDPNAAASLAAG